MWAAKNKAPKIPAGRQFPVLLAAAAVFTAAYCLAALTKPGFSPLANFASDLGVANPGASLFNWGLLITGLLLAAHYWLQGGQQKTLVGRLPALLGLLSCLALCLVGLFTEKTGSIHLLVSEAFFTLAVLSAALTLYLGRREFEVRTPSYLVGLLFVGSGIVLAITHLPAMENLAILLYGAWLLCSLGWGK